MSQQGKVFMVGAGPGDPKLITIRGKEAIERADVIIYDRLSNPRLLQYAKKEVELVYCGKQPQCHTLSQDMINHILVQHASLGKRVVRLKGGDPSIFGRVGEEAAYCHDHQIPFEMIPGITSGIAAPLYAGIPLTHRELNSSVTLVTGHKKTDDNTLSIDWARLAAGGDTLVFYMGVSNLSTIQEQLLLHGLDPQTPIALIRWGTTSQQKTITGTIQHIVEQVKKANFRSPAIIVIGEVVKLRDQLAWFEAKPLFGQTILLPSLEESNNQLLQALEDKGADVISWNEAISPKIMEIILKEQMIDTVPLTNPTSADEFCRWLNISESGFEWSKAMRIYCLNEKTAEVVQEWGHKVYRTGFSGNVKELEELILNEIEQKTRRVQAS